MVDVSLRLLEKASATGALQDAACALAADVTLTTLLSDIPSLLRRFRLSRGLMATDNVMYYLSALWTDTVLIGALFRIPFVSVHASKT